MDASVNREKKGIGHVKGGGRTISKYIICLYTFISDKTLMLVF